MKYIIHILILFLLFSCSKEAQPIQYGFDTCDYCIMQISDVRFGAEIVTGKGKIYKFDSIECMIDMVREDKLEEKDVYQYYLTIFDHPGSLAPADGSYILKSTAVPSPMARNLSAFLSESAAMDHLNEHEGEILIWSKALEEF